MEENDFDLSFSSTEVSPGQGPGLAAEATQTGIYSLAR